MHRSLVLLFASGLGFGYLPVVPGTWGTLPGIPLFLALAGWEAAHPWLAAGALLAFIGAACAIAHKAEALLGCHDARAIVIDEIAGYLTATFLLPGTLPVAVVAFLLFRVLDVLKPWPAASIDAKVPGGAGVVLDDVASGVYANLLTQLVFRWWL